MQYPHALANCAARTESVRALTTTENSPSRVGQKNRPKVKAAWDQVRLTVKWWVGVKPEGGDELRTRTGRRYQVLEVQEKALVCLVLPKDAPVQGKVFVWEWGRREKKAR